MESQVAGPTLMKRMKHIDQRVEEMYSCSESLYHILSLMENSPKCLKSNSICQNSLSSEMSGPLPGVGNMETATVFPTSPYSHLECPGSMQTGLLTHSEVPLAPLCVRIKWPAISGCAVHHCHCLGPPSTLSLHVILNWHPDSANTRAD